MKTLILLMAVSLGSATEAAGTGEPRKTDDSRGAAAVVVTREWVLPASLRWSFDTRWGDGGSILLVAGRSGLVEFPADAGPSKARFLVPGGPVDGAFFFSARMGRSDSMEVIGSPFAAFAWRRPEKKTGIDGQQDLSVLVDLDVHEDRVAILGADRDEKGLWSPDGAIVWTGEIGKAGPQLRPIAHSRTEPHAMTMARCHLMELGALRFASDGSLIVVPGVEPGIFLYGADGRLERTWDTEALGFVDRCPLTMDDFAEYMASGELRNAWWKTHVTLDEVLSIDGNPALFLREWTGSEVRWTLVLFDDYGQVARIRLPFRSSSPNAHLRADLKNGEELLVLLSDYSTSNDGEAKVVLARFVRGE